MAPQQRQLAASPAFTTDVASRVVRIGPWETYKPEPAGPAAYENSMITIARITPRRERIRMKNPGDLSRVCRFDDECRFVENFDYHDSQPDLFGNGIGKDYEGYRIAYIEGTGYVRTENDRSENIATPKEIYRFKKDLVEAARVDERVRQYVSDKGII